MFGPHTIALEVRIDKTDLANLIKPKLINLYWLNCVMQTVQSVELKFHLNSLICFIYRNFQKNTEIHYVRYFTVSVKCSPGTYINRTSNKCSECDDGTYQPRASQVNQIC